MGIEPLSFSSCHVHADESMTVEVSITMNLPENARQHSILRLLMDVHARLEDELVMVALDAVASELTAWHRGDKRLSAEECDAQRR